MPEEGIVIATTQLDSTYIVEISNTYTTKCITVEYYTQEEVPKEEIGLRVFKELLESSALGMVSAGTHDVKRFYKSALTNLKEIMSVDDIWEVKCASDTKMYNA